ncbi:MAG: hypothetical protein JRJ84_04075 [Deltaproteobacteria bacterium]|nr:hypothetical protein [Deltaproteobacteria bacterium]
MRAVSIHLFPRDEAAGFGDVQLAAPGLSPGERMVLWHGLPPVPIPDHQNIAPVVLEGDLDGRQVYAERVPRGVRLSGHTPPPELLPYVVSMALAGLHALHDAHQVHGGVGPDRLMLGVDGEVVLIGRGRQGGVRGLDLISAFSLLPGGQESTVLDADAGELSAELAERVDPEDPERLALWVRGVLPGRRVVEQALLTIGEQDDAVDEIVPDLGPDRGERGLLDRWSVTTASGLSGDQTDEEGRTQPSIGLTLWKLLSPDPPRPSPTNRFDGVQDVPSRGIRTLLAEEPPDILPLTLAADVAPFVIGVPTLEDQPTVVRATPRLSETRTTGPGVGPGTIPRWVQWAVAMGFGGALAWVLLQLMS